jgi:hypothetical protein
MANHAYVKTRKFMSPERISQLLDELNTSYFKGMLLFEYSNETDNSSNWGPHTWLIKYNGNDYDNGKKGDILRVCWLNTQRSWEIRHGGGADFCWWIDCVITNAIALEFNGTISDDGISDKWKGEEGYCKEFIDYLNRMKKHVEDSPRKTAFMQFEQDFAPPEFRADLGPRIEINFEIN